jgi:acetyltransferase-like isoleucine patch superfamily enzyme
MPPNSTSIYAGRNMARQLRPAIRICTWCFRLIPRWLCISLWGLSSIAQGKIGCGFRLCLAKRLAKQCGDDVYWGPNVTVRYWERLVIGNGTSIHANTWIDSFGTVTIGNSVAIAHNSSILSSDHDWSDKTIPIKDNPCLASPVVIADDVWIGCGCRVLSGVHIGQRTVIGAGSVVTRDIPCNSLAIGIPAKIIREI